MFTGLLEKVVRHEDLTEDEAAAAMREVMEGRANAAALGALLTGLVMKGERPSEIVGFARTMREHAFRRRTPLALGNHVDPIRPAERGLEALSPRIRRGRAPLERRPRLLLATRFDDPACRPDDCAQ